MDVFKLRDTVVREYRDYVESFINVFDTRVEAFVKQELDRGELWPDAVLQLNPAFEEDRSLGELAGEGLIARDTARFFSEDIRLYRHQREALDAAQRREPYVVTTGTGSGKSLTYLVPIYDAIARDQPERQGGVRAIIVYPMNALINSQLDALKEYQKNLPQSQVRFDRYTGQEKDEDRQRILANPPHILLTNYVMLEYVLVRPFERSLLATATRDLQFLVMDELHFYRGRQGADVAMLLRRLQQKAGHDLQVIGTSATMASEGDRDERRATIAGVTSKLFGVQVPPANVIDETLRRVARVPVPRTQDELRAAVQAEPPAAGADASRRSATARARSNVEAEPPPPDAQAVVQHALAAWVEEAFGLQTEEGRLVRRDPETFQNAVARLKEESGLEESLCRERLRATLEAGNAARLPSGEPVFAFRLHQFLSSGSSVFTTLEPADERQLTMQSQYKADDERVLFPLVFCRECGQDYYLASYDEAPEGDRLLPRPAMVDAPEEDTPGMGGFFALDDEGLWDPVEDELPEVWFDWLKSGPRIKQRYAPRQPASVVAAPDGSLGGNGVRGWFMARPFLICLRCRAVYDLREGDFRKLSSLSQTGRSTATTIVVNASVSGMAGQDVEAAECKALSFTDNRQDASLQAGHLNDFVQVAQLRAAIVSAIDANGELTFGALGPAIFDAMELRPQDFLKEPVDSGPGYEQGKRAMIELVEYRALEDLSRGWRINQPNLEQAGLLRIEYEGLRELAADDSLWHGLPAIGDAVPSKREDVLRAVLDHLRMQLALDVEVLSGPSTSRIAKNASQWLREPWTLDERDRLKTYSMALLPNVDPDEMERRMRVLRLSSRSAVARYLRQARTWDIRQNLTPADSDQLVAGIVARLRGHLLAVVKSKGEDRGVRVIAGALRWRQGSGQTSGPDPVRARSLYLRREIGQREPNRFFTNLYRQGARGLRGMVGHEHTGQVPADVRIEREEQFRKGELPVLFCSPTMELGVDIRTLNTVHMRNVPPTPANYAQRSGRAGRGGRPAFIAAFASQGNVHDQYFFRQRNRMIAGIVSPAQMDLRNKELVEAHLHAAWLAITGISLGGSIVEILDLDDPAYPIVSDKRADLEGASRTRYAERAIESARAIVTRAPELAGAWWFSLQWLEDTVRRAPEAFDAAFGRWRELYRSAVNRRDEATSARNKPKSTAAERQEAEQREREARREIELLLNQTRRIEDSDFYPYRYLASEGFLPGYNFPRLPVRAFVNVSGGSHTIDRPRFLGLSEFGPGNVIYHEGRKHRIDAAVLPPSGLEERLRRARLCNECGYALDEEAASADLCEHCGIQMDAATSDFPQRLLDQPAMRTRQVERINSEEEVRVRSGYEVTTHFRFGQRARHRRIQVAGADGTPLLELLFAPATTIWRINHGWRRSNKNGFAIDPTTGRWQRRDADLPSGEDQDPGIPQPLIGVKPFVTEDRNMLLARPIAQDMTEPFMMTLLYAIQRGIQFVHQVEEQEVAAELIGRGANRRLLLWEAAEGGTGVWERLVEEPDAIPNIARQALELCHYDPETGEESPDHEPARCTVGCYECLLSYANQLQHRLLDRRLVRKFLFEVARGTVSEEQAGRSREEQYGWLKGLADPASSFEREFLDFLFDNGYNLPDAAQSRPAPDIASQPDFYYERGAVPGVCVFVDGAGHDEPARQERDRTAREALEDKGYGVITIRFNAGLAPQLAARPDVFGDPGPA